MEQQGHKTARMQQEALSQEFASAVNLLAHPVAGAAAAGALGFGLAGHALGLWLGTVAGAAEVSRKMLTSGAAAPAKPERTAALRLVAAQPASRAPAKAREHEAPPRAVVSVAATEAVAATKPSGIARPAAPDDLKAISGIGPKLEKVLNGLGIWSYRQIEALGEAEIAWLDDHLGFSGRIGRDDWRGQAKRLSGGQ